MSTVVDSRGRIVVPKDLRAQFGLEPGCAVIIEAASDGIKIRRAIPRKEVLARLVGIIGKSNRRVNDDPLELKRMWERQP